MNHAKRHLRKFNGIPKEHFYLFLKECEFRFNTPASKDQLITLKHLVKKIWNNLSRPAPRFLNTFLEKLQQKAIVCLVMQAVLGEKSI